MSRFAGTGRMKYNVHILDQSQISIYLFEYKITRSRSKVSSFTYTEKKKPQDHLFYRRSHFFYTIFSNAFLCKIVKIGVCLVNKGKWVENITIGKIGNLQITALTAVMSVTHLIRCWNLNSWVSMSVYFFGDLSFIPRRFCNTFPHPLNISCIRRAITK